LKGYFGKDLVKSLLERSGYTVCHYGYEDTLLDAMSKRTAKTSNSNTGRRIRKSPDLLVYDDENIMLVEVKTRGKSPPYINADETNSLKEFWNDAILAIVVPDGNVFYAKRTNELEIHPNRSYVYYPLSYFEKFQDIFTRVRDEDISHYKEIALQISQIFMTKKEKTPQNRTTVS
jgi:Holliday junction resolvase